MRGCGFGFACRGGGVALWRCSLASVLPDASRDPAGPSLARLPYHVSLAQFDHLWSSGIVQPRVAPRGRAGARRSVAPLSDGVTISFKSVVGHTGRRRGLRLPKRCASSTAAARTVLCGTVIRCAQALSAAPDGPRSSGAC